MSHGKYINKGNDGFASVVNTGYVDKSMLIELVNKVLNTENRFLCVTRPRRFGKSDDALRMVLDEENERVAEIVEKVHTENTSILKYNDENSLACVLSLTFYTARNHYQMIREMPSGRGFADIVLIPFRNVELPAIVLELKYDHSADSAITQIHRQQYALSIIHYVGDVLLVGIYYDKKVKKHSCKIERITKSNTPEKKRNKKYKALKIATI